MPQHIPPCQAFAAPPLTPGKTPKTQLLRSIREPERGAENTEEKTRETWKVLKTKDSVLKNRKGQHDYRSMVLAKVDEDGHVLRYAPLELRGDHEVVMRGVAQNGRALQWVTEELKGHREVVMTAVAQNGWALEYAREELRGDREVVMTAVAQCGRALKYASEELRQDHEVVMKAVAKDGRALEHATEELRGDHEVVMKAVKEKGYAVQYASDEMRGDKEIMEAALATSSHGGAPPHLMKGPSHICFIFAFSVMLLRDRRGFLVSLCRGKLRNWPFFEALGEVGVH